jgi:hypothetical protein
MKTTASNAKDPEQGGDAAVEGWRRDRIWEAWGLRRLFVIGYRLFEAVLLAHSLITALRRTSARTGFRCENPITPSANAAASQVLGSGTFEDQKV